MAIKASLKKSSRGPAPTVTTDAPAKGKVVDVEASVDLEAAVAGEQEAAPETATAAVTTNAVATRTTTEVSHYQSSNTPGFQGDWESIPSKFPQVKIVQGSGKLMKEFNSGTIIYDGMELFPPVNKAKKEAPHKLTFVPVDLTLQFREKLSKERSDEGEMPGIAKDTQEVERNGGTTNWPYGQPQPDNYWEPSGRCLFLLERPEGSDHPGFAMSLDGKDYGIAVYYAAGGAFNRCPKLIRDTGKTSLFVPVIDENGVPVMNGKFPLKQKMLYKCHWTIEWDMEQRGAFTPYLPMCRLMRNYETGPELRSYCQTLEENVATVNAAAAAAE